MECHLYNLDVSIASDLKPLPSALGLVLLFSVSCALTSPS